MNKTWLACQITWAVSRELHRRSQVVTFIGLLPDMLILRYILDWTGTRNVDVQKMGKEHAYWIKMGRPTR